MLTKQETSLGRGAQEESVSVRSPGEPLCHVAHSLGFSGEGICFQVSGQSFQLRVLPGGAHFVLSRWIPTRILGGW